MSSQPSRGISQIVLASVLTMAGMVAVSNGAKAADTNAIDRQTAEKILRVLVPADQQLTLTKIIEANALDDLTPIEKEQLFQALQSAARNLVNSQKPIF